MSMNAMNGVGSDSYGSYGSKNIGSTKGTTGKNSKSEVETKQSSAESTAGGVVYDKTSEKGNKATYSINKMSAEDRQALVQQLKADQAARQESFLGIVKQMLGQQANVSNLSSLFTPENMKNIDPETIAKAKEDVSEDGYYGIKQTSQRLFDFASALAGDDVEKMKKMQDAMMKGFEQATKAWGKELPQLCKDTIDAANQLFDNYYNSKSAN